MLWRTWENSAPIDRLKSVENNLIQPLIVAAVGFQKLENMLRQWEDGETIVLYEEEADALKEEIINSCNLVNQLAGIAQSIQIAHKVSQKSKYLTHVFKTIFFS